MTRSSVTVIGPGAIGAALAGGLVEATHEPTLVVRTPFERLRVEWPDGSLDVEATCVSDPALLAPADVVIVATKATHNEAVVEHLQASVQPGSILVIAQNGVDHLDRFAGVVGSGVEVVPAIPMLPSKRLGPGHAVVGQPSKLIIPDGPAAAAVDTLFGGSFIDIEASADWTSAAWFKLILNASSGGIGVLTRRGSEIFDDPDAQQLLLGLMEEVAAVGRAEGAELADDLPTRLQQYQIATAGSHTSSIVLDRLAGIPTEWRQRNEIVVRLAEEHGIAVPLNHTVATLMRLGEPEFERR